MCVAPKDVFHQLNKNVQFRRNRIKEMEDFLNAKISDRENMSKTLNTYITTLDYPDKTLLVLSSTSSSVSLILFTTTIGAPVGISRASISLACLIEKWEGRKEKY